MSKKREVNNQKKNNIPHKKNDQDDKKVEEIELDYNFIKYPEKWYYPYKTIEELPEHNKVYNETMDDDKYNMKKFMNNGFIEYKITTKDKLTTNFRENSKGELFISGSEIRGKIRSNLEILSFSYPDFIDTSEMSYRDFAGNNKKRKEQYISELGLNNQKKKIENLVEAGYLFKKGDKYYVRPAKKFKNKNFQTIEEYRLLNMGNRVLKEQQKMYIWYSSNNYSKKSKPKCENDKFIPYQKQVTFGLNDKNGIKVVKTADGNKNNDELLYTGILYCSTNASNKKRHYVINETDNKEPIIVKDSTITAYNKNMKKFKVTTGNQDTIEDFYKIFGGRELKDYEVVFYTTDDDGEINNIGRTPYLKILYKNTIKDILNYNQNIEGISYANAMFGFTGEGEGSKLSYKSRLRFTPAEIVGIKGEDLSSEDFFLPEPSASAFGMYLEQKKNYEIITYVDEIVTYANDIDEINLRGNKFYHIKEKSELLDKDKYKDEEDKLTIENMITNKYVIPENSDITGKIHFKNLSNKELGLLVLSIESNHLEANDKTEKESNEHYELIGGAKAYGYGKSKIEITKISRLKNMNGILPNFNDLGYEELDNINKKNVINSWIDHMGKKYLNSNTIVGYVYSKKINYKREEKDKYENTGEGYDQNMILKKLKCYNNSLNLDKLANKFNRK